MTKNKSLVVKYFKRDVLYTTQILSPNAESAIAVGQNSKLNNGFFGTDFSYDDSKGAWGFWVNAKKRVLALDKKINVSDDISIVVSEPPTYKILPLDIESGTVKKIQIKIVDPKGSYIESDILPYKRRQIYKFAKAKIKIKRPESTEWEKLSSTAKGYNIFVKTIEVPDDSKVKTPVVFTSKERELIKKIAMSYAGIILLTLGIYYTHKLYTYFFPNEKKFDVVKVDETLLEEKRKMLFNEQPKKPKVVEPVDKPPVTPKKAQKRMKGFEKSKKIESGRSKKAIAEKSKKPSSGGGKKGSKLAVEGVKSNKIKITQGSKPGAKGHNGQADATKSKLSRISGLSGSIGFKSNANLKADNLHSKTGTGGDFSSLRKGNQLGKDGGTGVGGRGGGTHGIGSYKVGGVGTLSLGGATRGGGTGVSLSQGKTSRGFVDGLEEEIIVAGGLDRSVIERVIRRNLGDINYCYERRLNARPNLSGVFEAQFAIGANGKVQSVKAARNSLADGVLDQCIRNSIKNWQFPKPVGGTVVNVNYPFILKST